MVYSPTRVGDAFEVLDEDLAGWRNSRRGRDRLDRQRAGVLLRVDRRGNGRKPPRSCSQEIAGDPGGGWYRL